MGQRVSHRIEDRQEGGSLLGADGPVKVRFDEGKYIDKDEWNENWKSEGASDYDYEATLFACNLYPYDGDDNEEDATPQMWSCGNPNRLVPSDDGEYLEVAEGSNATGMVNSVNRALLEDSIIEAGGSEDWLERASGFDGMVAMVERAERKVKMRGKEQTLSTLLVTEIIDEPGGKAKTKKKTSKKTSARSKSKAKEEDDEEIDVEEAAGEVLTQILEDNDGAVLKAKMLSQIANLLATEDWSNYSDHKREISKLLTDPKGAFVKGFDGAKIKGPKIVSE